MILCIHIFCKLLRLGAKRAGEEKFFRALCVV
jgi:hypothetical protein